MSTLSANNSKVFILDGGFSSQISRHVASTPDGDPLWTARFLQTHPSDIISTHLDFLRAGADVISTNTYQASIHGFVKHLKSTKDEAYNLICSAVHLAKIAVKIYKEECLVNNLPIRTPLIAGSVGPYGAHLNDGSEYTGSYANKTPAEIISDWHKPRLKAIVNSGVDLLALETVPCDEEALALVDLIKKYPTVKAWLSFSIKDEKTLANGEDIKVVAEKCRERNPDQILAVGANCCSPKVIGDMIKYINDDGMPAIPIVTYPNSGEKYISEKGWVNSDCPSLHKFVNKWLDLNVKYVGGCCRTYEEDIKNIHSERVFGISARKKEADEKITILLNDNEVLRGENLKLGLEISKLKKEMAKLKDEQFSEYLSLMRERDARYTVYFENVALQQKLKELDGSRYGSSTEGTRTDPIVLRIALDRCREQLATTQNHLKKMSDEYAETVPRREHDSLEARFNEVTKKVHAITAELDALQNTHKRILAQKRVVEEELIEWKEKCSELGRTGTPRPRWEICADFIGGGKDRWWQLAKGLSSRDKLRVLLKELGPAAESEHMEFFDGLGMDPVIPPYLRYEGRVRNLRLSRREVSIIINDIWLSKFRSGHNMSMQEYVTKYFEDRYQQASVRAEWAYNLCAGAEQMLDDPRIKLFWGVVNGHLSEDIYWGLRQQWLMMKEQMYKHCKDEILSIEDFEKVTRATFPMKSEVDIKNLMDVVKKQLKLKWNNTDVILDKLFQEDEEGFDRGELARELLRQRQTARDKFVREVAAELGGCRANNLVTVDNLKRAFAIVDPAIDHTRMERYIRWALPGRADAGPLRAALRRLAAADLERAGPRQARHRPARRQR